MRYSILISDNRQVTDRQNTKDGKIYVIKIAPVWNDREGGKTWNKNTRTTSTIVRYGRREVQTRCAQKNGRDQGIVYRGVKEGK